MPSLVRSNGKALPHNLDAEAAVIGGVLLSAKALHQIADVLEPDDFYHPTHAAIYQALLDLDGASKPIDAVTVAEQMRRSDTHHALRSLGGEGCFAELVNGVITVENIAHHARIVRDARTARQLIETAQEIVARGYGDHGSLDDFLDESERSIFAIGQRTRRQSYVPLKSIMRSALDTLERRFNRKESVTGVPSGLDSLDEITAGFQPGELAIIAGRPSMGKTALALSCAQYSAKLDPPVPTLIFSLEMSKESLLERLISSEALIDSTRMRTGRLSQSDWVSLSRHTGRLSSAPIWIDDSGSPTLLELRAKARRWRADPAISPGGEGLGLVIVDYLQLVSGGRSRDGREREIAEISRGLKALAKDLRVPVVALSQLNRSVESRSDKRPQLSDLRESGAIEQDADLIAFVYRDEVYNKETQDKGIAEIIIGKQRNGPTGVARVRFDPSTVRFFS